jgi:hypothetical protein
VSLGPTRELAEFLTGLGYVSDLCAMLSRAGRVAAAA